MEGVDGGRLAEEGDSNRFHGLEVIEMDDPLAPNEVISTQALRSRFSSLDHTRVLLESAANCRRLPQRRVPVLCPIGDARVTAAAVPPLDVEQNKRRILVLALFFVFEADDAGVVVVHDGDPYLRGKGGESRLLPIITICGRGGGRTGGW